MPKNYFNKKEKKEINLKKWLIQYCSSVTTTQDYSKGSNEGKPFYRLFNIPNNQNWICIRYWLSMKCYVSILYGV